MKPEQKVWQRLKRALDQIPGMQAHRIELKTAESGFPDVMYGYGGIGFIELKWGDDLSDWRTNQRRFAKLKEKIGVPCYVLVGDETSTVLLRSKDHFDTKKITKPLLTWGRRIDPGTLGRFLYIHPDPCINLLRDSLSSWPVETGRMGDGQFIQTPNGEMVYYSDQGGVYTIDEYIKTK